MKKNRDGRYDAVHYTSLYGHLDAVTNIAASQQHGIAVSTSFDCSSIVWDLNRMRHVHTLQHREPASLLYINEATVSFYWLSFICEANVPFFFPFKGDIVTCIHDYITLWSINGGPGLTVNTCSTGARHAITSITSVLPAVVRFHILL